MLDFIVELVKRNVKCKDISKAEKGAFQRNSDNISRINESKVLFLKLSALY